MIFNMVCGSDSSEAYALILAKFPSGTTSCTCSQGDTTLSATTEELGYSQCVFEVPSGETWTLTCNDETYTAFPQTVTVEEGASEEVELLYQQIIYDAGLKSGYLFTNRGHATYNAVDEDGTIHCSTASTAQNYPWRISKADGTGIDFTGYAALNFSIKVVSNNTSYKRYVGAAEATYTLGNYSTTNLAKLVTKELATEIKKDSEDNVIYYEVSVPIVKYPKAMFIGMEGHGEFYINKIFLERPKCRVYGIMRDITASSPAWTRTDDSVGFAATASVGDVAGSSDFDKCYPWNSITRETLSTGDVMVRIPKFYYCRYRVGDVEYIKIAEKANVGFELHPAFNHGGVETDYIYVGAYKTSEGNVSVSGAAPLAAQTRATMRTNAKAKGDGWGIIDVSTLSAIQMLILVEFADNDVQTTIGRGYCNRMFDSFLNTGTCDSVPNLTGRPAGTDGETDVVWRGIEGFWGNALELVDGVNWNSGTYYVCNDPSKYKDATSTGYTALSYKGLTDWNGHHIEKMGLDAGSNPHVMFPNVGTLYTKKYYPDGCHGASGWRVLRSSGSRIEETDCGLFYSNFQGNLSNKTEDDIFDLYCYNCSRLLYIPSTTT